LLKHNKLARVRCLPFLNTNSNATCGGTSLFFMAVVNG
jgi:hypothetical protein